MKKNIIYTMLVVCCGFALNVAAEPTPGQCSALEQKKCNSTCEKGEKSTCTAGAENICGPCK